jgi:Fe-S-cluster containining protein
MRDDFTGEYPADDEAAWMLNGPGGACVFYKEEEGIGVCGIHAARPLVCRLFCCEEDMGRIRGTLKEEE